MRNGLIWKAEPAAVAVSEKWHMPGRFCQVVGLQKGQNRNEGSFTWRERNKIKVGWFGNKRWRRMTSGRSSCGSTHTDWGFQMAFSFFVGPKDLLKKKTKSNSMLMNSLKGAKNLPKKTPKKEHVNKDLYYHHLKTKLPLLKSHPTLHMKGNKTETREPPKE